MNDHLPQASGDRVALAFATAVAMWLAGFASRIPAVSLPAMTVLTLLAMILFAGGMVSGAATTRGWRGGAAVGALAQLVNLLVLGAILGERPLTEDERAAARSPTPSIVEPARDADGMRTGPWSDALVWVPGTIAVGAAIGAAGGLLGRRLAPPHQTMRADWSAPLVGAAWFATLGVIALGGLVTGFEVGLAVPDWPSTFGWTMFLYPLSRMTGGIYYEHSHRLMGSLVGLVVLVVAVHLGWRDPRPTIKRMGFAVLLVVCGQGLLGGLRVLEQNPRLAALHGILGQVVLALVAALCAATTRTWRNYALPRTATPSDRLLAHGLLGALLAQLALGAATRHHAITPYAHLLWALPTSFLCLALGSRAMGMSGAPRHARRAGSVLLGLIVVQLALGFAAFIATRLPRASDAPESIEVAVTTMHQTCGALVLATAAWIAAWFERMRGDVPGPTWGLGRP